MTHCVSNPNHSDRLAAGLPMAPHPERGDLDEVLRLRRVIARLAPFFADAVEETVLFVEELEASGVDPTEPCLADLRKVLGRLAATFHGDKRDGGDPYDCAAGDD